MESAVAPPPPPPPPPPGPPPPPPGPPPPGMSSGLKRSGSKMRTFNWDAIPNHVVVGKHNIWTAEKTTVAYELDTKRMEELFSHSQQKVQKEQKRQSVRGLPSIGQGTEVVTLLNSKRSMNIGIFLKQFKRPIRDLIEDISSGNGLKFGTGKLKELCKLLPEKEEVKELLGFTGNQSALPEADLFMLLLIKVPSYEERLKNLVLKEEFFPLMDEMKQSIDTMITAGKELLESDDLHTVIRLVLKTGNYMNAGGYAGSAIGFRMASLLKLVDTRANKPGMNLMHFVVMEAQKVDAALLNVPNKLSHIAAAARIHKEDIESDFQREVKKVKTAKEEAQKHVELQAQMEDFLMEAECRLTETDLSLQELGSVSDSVAEYFCEDPSKFRLDECCSIFSSFCEKFLRAIQENSDREVAEVKRRTRERLQSASNAAKRRSTATCSMRDKDMEGVALESVLQRFLTSRVSRRQRVSRTPSPTRAGLSETPLQANLPLIEQGNRGSVKGIVACKKNEWNERNPTVTSSSDQKDKSYNKTDWKENVIPHPEEGQCNPNKPVQKQPSSTQPTDRTGCGSSSTARPMSRMAEEEEGNEEEAQKLREVSRKVLRYQSSRGSVCSGEYSLDQQTSPPAPNKTSSPNTVVSPKGTTIATCSIMSSPSASPGQRTSQGDRKWVLRDTCGGSESLAKYLKSRLSPKEVITRRHSITLSSMSAANEDEDNFFIFPPTPTLGVIGKMKSVDTGLISSMKNKASGEPNVPGQSEKCCVQELVSKSPSSKCNVSTSKINISRHSEPTGLALLTMSGDSDTFGAQQGIVSKTLSAVETPAIVKQGEPSQHMSSSVEKTKPPLLHLKLTNNLDGETNVSSPTPLQTRISQQPTQTDPIQSPKHNIASPSKSPKPKTSEANGFLAFFKRLGERSRPL
ncbi:inverted formin-2 [Esox lucius]|uniref:FH2 domain-containing protein n=1 Tax=Esox lucius TaxID=8010 RepID=A0A3P8XQ38_ESOLU|nr:inverted formin-2 [Esox lucius]XP_019897275.2 inverted formin-2 [Esox lucius]XP_019897290.2 inverted formin-2 [Esox lucius]